MRLRDGHLQHRLCFEKATPHPLLQAAEAFGTAISYALGRQKILNDEDAVLNERPSNVTHPSFESHLTLP
jgi:hypothetical protein